MHYEIVLIALLLETESRAFIHLPAFLSHKLRLIPV